MVQLRPIFGDGRRFKYRSHNSTEKQHCVDLNDLFDQNRRTYNE